MIKRVVKRAALICYMVDLNTTRIIQKLRGEPLYQLRGTCNGCGACCRSPMVQVFPLFFHIKSARKLILLWHQLVNGFEYVGEDRNNKTFIFRCSHWDPKSQKCDSYDSRPGMCRDYPRNLIYSTNPVFLKECSYYAVDKNAKTITEALEELDLPPEKLNLLKRKLHLSDSVPETPKRPK